MLFQCVYCGSFFVWDGGRPGRKACFTCRPPRIKGTVDQVLEAHGAGEYDADLALRFGTSPKTISSIIRTFSSSHQHSFRKPKTDVLTLSRSFIDGVVMSDGNLRKRHSVSFRLGSKYQEYVSYIKSCFEDMGVLSTEVKGPYIHATNGGIHFGFGTRVYPGFDAFYSRWYPQGKKVLPSDVVVDSEFLLQWYLGDGSSSNGFPQFHNCDFSKESMWELYQRMQVLFSGSLSFYDYINPNRVIIRIRKDGLEQAVKFLGMSSPVACYSYKWDWASKVGLGES